MFSRGMILTLALVVGSTMGFGKATLKPAEANDTGKILAGLAAGALVYGILDQADRSSRSHPSQSRGYYDGNRGTWTAPRQPSSSYRAPAPRRTPSSRTYDRGYDHGHRVGYDRGYDHGHKVGHDRGYDRGYNHGFRDGYDYGRRSPWGCWGY